MKEGSDVFSLKLAQLANRLDIWIRPRIVGADGKDTDQYIFEDGIA